MKSYGFTLWISQRVASPPLNYIFRNLPPKIFFFYFMMGSIPAVQPIYILPPNKSHKIKFLLTFHHLSMDDSSNGRVVALYPADPGSIKNFSVFFNYLLILNFCLLVS